MAAPRLLCGYAPLRRRLRFRQILCIVEMLLKNGQCVLRIGFQGRILRVCRFFLINLDGFRVSRDHLLDVTTVKGCSFQLLERVDHRLVGFGVDCVWHGEIGLLCGDVQLAEVVGVVGDQRLAIVFDWLRGGRGLRQLSKVGLHHIGLPGKVDKLLVGHGRSFRRLLLGQSRNCPKSNAADH